MQTLLKRMVQRRDKLSQLEKQVFDYIIRNPETVAGLKLDELSKRLYVSTATISRTCRQLGFRGFQDMKFALEQHVVKDKPVVPSGSPGSFLSAHLDRFRSEMEHTLALADQDKMKQAAEWIYKSIHVEFFGVGSSFAPCLDAAKKLMFAGKMCSAREDWDELRCAAASLGPKDTAILVSFSGETVYIKEFAHILLERKVKTIAITGNEPNRLQEMADLSFRVGIEHCYYGELDMCSRFPFIMILDAIILAYLEQVKK